jgi:succinate dehydrogenase/fumarate reductase flavoprotein subunit
LAIMKEQRVRQVMEADVVVVGYGGAGATAAITAHEHGAKVLILEKMPASGGNTRVCVGAIMEPTDMRCVQYFETLCKGTTEREIIEAFVEEAMKNKEWVKALGADILAKFKSPDVLYPPVPIPTWPYMQGAQYVSRFRAALKNREPDEEWCLGGKSLWELLSSEVERRSITVMTSTPAKELIQSENGEVVGVVAEKEGEKLSVMSRKAVVLTCGGLEHNEAMKQAFLPGRPFYGLGCLGNTGDGVVMAQKVGAALWHMTSVASPLGFKAPEYEAAFHIRMYGEKFIYVDSDGKRFVNETGGVELHDAWRTVLHFDPSRLSYPRIPSYAIFDDVTRRRGPIHFQALGANQDYEWSLDNSKEVAKGWISKGKTIRELARRISIDESSLENTVNKYNQFCKDGRDPETGRSKETLVPIDKSPYYAIQLWPCLLNTQGGARRDKNARVLNHEGKPIPRLYSAGEFGSIWGFVYEAGGNIAECLAFGRIAGRNAASEEPCY